MPGTDSTVDRESVLRRYRGVCSHCTGPVSPERQNAERRRDAMEARYPWVADAARAQEAREAQQRARTQAPAPGKSPGSNPFTDAALRWVQQLAQEAAAAAAPPGARNVGRMLIPCTVEPDGKGGFRIVHVLSPETMIYLRQLAAQDPAQRVAVVLGMLDQAQEDVVRCVGPG